MIGALPYLQVLRSKSVVTYLPAKSKSILIESPVNVSTPSSNNLVSAVFTSNIVSTSFTTQNEEKSSASAQTMIFATSPARKTPEKISLSQSTSTPSGSANQIGGLCFAATPTLCTTTKEDSSNQQTSAGSQTFVSTSSFLPQSSSSSGSVHFRPKPELSIANTLAILPHSSDQGKFYAIDRCVLHFDSFDFGNCFETKYIPMLSLEMDSHSDKVPMMPFKSETFASDTPLFDVINTTNTEANMITTTQTASGSTLRKLTAAKTTTHSAGLVPFSSTRSSFDYVNSVQLPPNERTLPFGSLKNTSATITSSTSLFGNASLLRQFGMVIFTRLT